MFKQDLLRAILARLIRILFWLLIILLLLWTPSAF